MRSVNAIPRLSIGLPVFNGEDYLDQSLDALLGQTYTDFELIISDNASTDSTADICRRYEKQDSRVRYIRQLRNIGSAPNHNFVFRQSRGELFKWAAADDLYARDLLQHCIEALDQHPDAVLAHSWTAAIDTTGAVTQALEYPLATDVPSAPARFRSMLFGGDLAFGAICADDMYGVIRSRVLHAVAPHGSYYHADRAIMAEISLHGPFYQVPKWLYFRRDHSDRPQYACPTARMWCANLDPRRASRLRHPTVRLLAEYVYGYGTAISRAPLSLSERQACYRLLGQWAAARCWSACSRLRGRRAPGAVSHMDVAHSGLSVEAVVAGRESSSL